jgi:hypothetical protein
MQKKIAFIGSITILGLFAVWRYFSSFFIDEFSLEESFRRHLLYMIIIAIIIGLLYLFLFIKIFPKGWNNQSSSGKIGIIVVFLILSFAVVRQSSITLNLILPEKNIESFNGTLTNKRIETTRKGTKFYHFEIQNSYPTVANNFSVSKKMFDKFNIGDTINKKLKTGFFGIKYFEK